MSKKRVYASIEIADQEIRLVVLEIFESRYNVLRVESVACSGVQNQTIVNEANVVSAIRTAVTNAQAALGYRIERVLLAIPSVNVMRSNQKSLGMMLNLLMRIAFPILLMDRKQKSFLCHRPVKNLLWI